jgi:hypothetical protein
MVLQPVDSKGKKEAIFLDTKGKVSCRLIQIAPAFGHMLGIKADLTMLT